MQAYLGEFIGTMILIILGDGVVAGVLLRNSKAENSGWIVITFGWAQVPGYIIAQFLGAFVGAVIVWLAYLAHWAPTEDAGLKLGVFRTAPGIYNTPANIITEIIGTFVLVFGVFGIVSNAGAIPGDLSAVIATRPHPPLVGVVVFGI